MATLKVSGAGASEILMLVFTLSLCLSVTYAVSSGTPRTRCPPDYRYRVETCVIEAQVAPQAGGGLPLITDRNKLEELCTRGILQKTIDCLRDIHTRCAGNATREQELDMLFSIEDWRRGKALLCEDLARKLVFKDHFDCVSQFGPRISSCILRKTHLFRQAVIEAGLIAHKALHDITCNFAENIVMCLERPLARACSLVVVETMTSALHRFLPPACAPVPAVFDRQPARTGQRGQVSSEAGESLPETLAETHGSLPEMLAETESETDESWPGGLGEAMEEDTDGGLAQPHLEHMNLETIIVEGGQPEDLSWQDNEGQP